MFSQMTNFLDDRIHFKSNSHSIPFSLITLKLTYCCSLKMIPQVFFIFDCTKIAMVGNV